MLWVKDLTALMENIKIMHFFKLMLLQIILRIRKCFAYKFYF